MGAFMKQIVLVFLFFAPSLSLASQLEKAPLEWLAVETLKIKLSSDHSSEKELDPLLKEIFEVGEYYKAEDELIFTSSDKSQQLRRKLINFLEEKEILKHDNAPDPLFLSWEREKSRSPINVRLKKTDDLPQGLYFFNHVHTDLSQDNENLEFLKIDPQETYEIINEFLKDRRTRGVVAMTDHDTDRAYDEILPIMNERLTALRSIEWGGRTHMGLIGIDQNWDLLSRGREFSGEESIRMSRSSGGFRIVNHPNRKNRAFPYTSWLDADGVEVWNTILENSPFSSLGIERSYNRDAKKQWSDSLKKGNRYTAVGGSDFHFIIPCLRDRILHYPANFIPTSDTGQAKELLMKGRNSFSTRPTAPKLTLQAKLSTQKTWTSMGDQVSGSGLLDVRLFADFRDKDVRLNSFCYNTVTSFWRFLTFWKKDRWEFRFYNKFDELIAKKRIDANDYDDDESFVLNFELFTSEQGLIRAELWKVNRKGKQVDILGVTNPVYL